MSSASCCRTARSSRRCGSPKGLRQAIREFRFVWGASSSQVGATIGIVADRPRTPRPSPSVMSAVDVACYAAKDAGRNRVHVYERRQRPAAAPRDAVGVAPARAPPTTGRLELYFQPIVPIGRHHGSRAALRADAAAARRRGRTGAAERVHPGRRALQRHAGDRPLGGAARALERAARSGQRRAQPLPLLRSTSRAPLSTSSASSSSCWPSVGEPRSGRRRCASRSPRPRRSPASSNVVYFMRELKHARRAVRAR